MPKKETGDWYYDSGRHQQDLERDLAGLLTRRSELDSMDVPDEEKQAFDKAVSDAREQLRKLYGVGQKQAAKRPAEAHESRSKAKGA